MLQVTEWSFSAKASDGSSSREDLSSQLFRRNEHIRKLEFKLSGMCLDTYKPLLLEEIFLFELFSFITHTWVGIF